jgi:hypothetical protein
VQLPELRRRRAPLVLERRRSPRSKIAFVESDSSPGSTSLWLMDTQGTSAKRVTEAEGDVSWQPLRPQG